MRAPHATFTMRGLALSHLHELHSRLRRGGRHGLVHGTGSENTGDGLMRTTESGEGTNGQRYFEGATEHGAVRAKTQKSSRAPRRSSARADVAEGLGDSEIGRRAPSEGRDDRTDQ